MEPLIKGSDEKRPPAIEVPFEIVVACGVDGVTIQPGGYRITAQALKNRKDEKLLVRNLAAVAQRRAEVDPAIRPGLGSSFWSRTTARRRSGRRAGRSCFPS
ncbi:hypothetical protein [Planctomyces sp. SH-PL62]|uniref:hypothetical protein n=1 Tax=Planctomyces sp. SH-PL62 TaxID=1636152 RepID=UPI00078E0E79|nr:hypothetical protein [Planctomyces sp. SH-PL62]AMV38736.1 hypothetical protein VT85_14955 [Planctomyces sp. SH-PL62]